MQPTMVEFLGTPYVTRILSKWPLGTSGVATKSNKTFWICMCIGMLVGVQFFKNHQWKRLLCPCWWFMGCHFLCVMGHFSATIPFHWSVRRLSAVVFSDGHCGLIASLSPNGVSALYFLSAVLAVPVPVEPMHMLGWNLYLKKEHQGLERWESG